MKTARIAAIPVMVRAYSARRMDSMTTKATTITSQPHPEVSAGQHQHRHDAEQDDAEADRPPGLGRPVEPHLPLSHGLDPAS